MEFIIRIFSMSIVFISFLLSIFGSLFGFGGSNPPETTELSTSQEIITEYITNGDATTKIYTTEYTTSSAVTTEIYTTAREGTTTQPAVENVLKIRIGAAQVRFGVNEESVVAAMGQPTERLLEYQKDGKSIVSLVYADDYTKLSVFQIFDGKLSGFYTINREAVLSDNDSTYSLGNTDSRDSIDVTIREYRDSFSDNKIYAFHVCSDGFSYRTSNLTNFKNQSVINFHVVNALRAINGVGSLEYCEKAETAITLHCEDMVENNYFDHTSLDGTSAADRMTAQGIVWSACAENIAYGYKDAYDFANGWYNSAGHRNAMLDGKYDYIGVGYAISESGVVYSGQNYYKPMDY